MSARAWWGGAGGGVRGCVRACSMCVRVYVRVYVRACVCVNVWMGGGGGSIIGASCHKHHFCRDESCVCGDKTRLLSRQKYACHVCRDKRPVLSLQTRVCDDVSRQNYTCGSSRQ